MNLKISSELSLPLDVVTQKLGWLGVTGSGKTYGASKLAELLWAAQAQFIVLDPVGVWYGLRLAKKGDGAGVPIPVFGGLHGDVPLEATAGAMIADLIVDRGLSAVLDVSQFDSDAQKAKFASDFAERFFFRKKASPSAVHVFLEECQEFVPQNPMRGEEQMLHRFHRLQKLGRNFGIGTSLISQRPQEVNKKALNQAQTLFVFRLTGSQERKAVEVWIEDKGLDQDIVGGLPKLKTGDCHLWSPAWLQVSKMIRIAEKATFDASATPQVGMRSVVRELTPIDLERIRHDMASTIEKARANDPAVLLRKVAELEAQLKRPNLTPHVKALSSVQEKIVEKRVEVPVIKDAQIKRLETLVPGFGKKADSIVNSLTEVLAAIKAVRNHQNRPASHVPAAVPRFQPRPAPSAGIPGKIDAFKSSPGNQNDLSPAKQRILDALAWLESAGLSPADRRQVAFLAEQSSTSGNFTNYLGSLRSAGLIDYPSAGVVALTGGRSLAKSHDRPVTSEDLQHMILEKLPRAKRHIVQALIAIYPNPMSRADLAAAAYQSPTSGNFTNYLGNLRSLGLLDYPSQGWVKASDKLFIA